MRRPGALRARVAALVLVLAVASAACVTPRDPPAGAVRTSVGTFVVAFEEWDEPMRDLVVSVLPEASAPLARWGGLEEPVRVRVFRAHWELEDAVGRPIPSISAWARRTEVLLESPRNYPVPPGAEKDPALEARVRRVQVTDLLRHELTHSLMFQKVGRPPTEARDRIPFWFREGMATVTAGEYAHWPPPETLSQWLARNPGVDVLRDGDRLSRTEVAIAYAGALHGFDFLVRRYGDAVVLRILAAMGRREGFPEAFERAVGISVESFGTDFARYLRWRGFAPRPPTSRPAATSGI